MKGLKIVMEEIRNNKVVDYEQLKRNLEKIAPTQSHFDNLLELLDFVYYLGIEDGDDSGYANALKDNHISSTDEQEIYEEAYENARNDMESDLQENWQQGFEEGVEEGEHRGYEEGKEEGDREGYDRGYDDGKEEGYSEGYEEAYTENGDRLE